MKRDPRLRDLSDDHHQALVMARDAKRAAEAGDESAAAAVWGEIKRRFEVEVRPHFEIEERLLVPAVEACGGEALNAQLLEEHRELEGLVASGEAPLGLLAAFGELMRAHVRFEERVYFPFCQERLGAEALAAVLEATQEWRRARGLI